MVILLRAEKWIPTGVFPGKYWLIMDLESGMDDTSRVDCSAPDFNNYQALRIIGYNIKDSLAAVAAFRRHWLQDSVYQPFDSASEKILYNLSQEISIKKTTVRWFFFTIQRTIYINGDGL